MSFCSRAYGRDSGMFCRFRVSLFTVSALRAIEVGKSRSEKDHKGLHGEGDRMAIPEFLLAQPARSKTTEQVVQARLTLPGFLLSTPTESKTPEQVQGRDPSLQAGRWSYIWDREIDGV